MILAFATADLKIRVFSDRGWWFLLGSAIASVLSPCTYAGRRLRWFLAVRCGVPRPGVRSRSASSSGPPSSRR
ncbi:hypothetical protein [Nocardioides sp. B-3]|uniref:hypothetical protein n=1 Tax=Nocardioides sp. B-3 TaxID=2895565 RepID=UPI002152475D|nr:hypothetical protein [Nocardioides sp. B-3]UUZ58905.1 hypothetical protein LP418_23050 [Nocardioides sp. B-3]